MTPLAFGLVPLLKPCFYYTILSTTSNEICWENTGWLVIRQAGSLAPFPSAFTSHF